MSNEKIGEFVKSLDVERDRHVEISGRLSLTVAQITKLLQIVGVVPEDNKLADFNIYYGNVELSDEGFGLQIHWKEIEQ